MFQQCLSRFCFTVQCNVILGGNMIQMEILQVFQTGCHALSFIGYVPSHQEEELRFSNQATFSGRVALKFY